MAGVRTWIDRLGLSTKDAARHVGIDADQLDRVLKFPEETLPVRAVLQILEGLGLGLAGVEELSPVAILRHLDQQREAKGISKKRLAAAAELNRTYMTALFQELKPEPRLETIMKIAGALGVELVIEKQRELAPLEPLPAPTPTPPSRPPTIAPSPPPSPQTAPTASSQPPAPQPASSAGAQPPPQAPAAPASSPDRPSAAPRPEARETPLSAAPSNSETPRSTATSPRPAPATTERPVAPQGATPDPAPTTAARSSVAPERPQTPTHISTSASPRSSDRPAAPTSARSTATPNPASPAVEGAGRTTSTANNGPHPAETASQTTAAANDLPKGNSGAAAAATAGATVATGRWLSDSFFARMTEELAATKLQIAEEQHRTAMIQQEMEYERQHLAQQAAEQAALELAAERAAALKSAVVLGGTATAAVVGGSTALAFVDPEDRRTAQAIMSITGGALSIAGAVADRNSSTRGALIGVGGGLILAAVIDLIRQSASSTRGGLAGVTYRGTALPHLVVETVAPRSNAAQAGLTQGDIIVAVDGVAVDAVGATAALQRTVGEVGTSLKLDVIRDFYEQTVVVVRAPV